MTDPKSLALLTIETLQSMPKLLEQIYGDLAKPGVTQVGKALETILGLGNTALIPLRLLNEKFKLIEGRNLDNYRKKLIEIEAEKIIPVIPEIGIPIMDKLSYVQNETLAELYINLLAKASSKEFCSLAHPAFVKIIDLFSPDEALLIQALKQANAFPTLQIEAQLVSGGDARIGQFYTPLEKIVSLIYPQNIQVYLTNLDRSGIIEIVDNTWLSNEKFYDDLKSQHALQESPPFDPKTIKAIRWKKGHIDVTPFGKLFIDACAK
ncbi:MAG: DUF4393 domain-containing protein [Bacteriovorax sp.]|jgi:hypothetical protein